MCLQVSLMVGGNSSKLIGGYDFVIKCVYGTVAPNGSFTEGKLYECQVHDVYKTKLIDDNGAVIILDTLDGFTL